MNNLFSAGLLSISIIALNGCKESVDLKSNHYNSSTHSSSQTTSSTFNTTNVSSQTPTSIIVTPPGVTVVRVNNVTDHDIETTTDSTPIPTTESETTPDTGVTAEPVTSSESDTTTDSPDTMISSTSVCEAFADPIDTFVRVQMNFGLLSGTPYISGELGGLDSLTVAADAATNATVLKLDSTVSLVPGQLITYVGTNGQNRVAKIGEVRDGEVTITSGQGLETAISKGSVISNFYNDPTHPNTNGYKAMADFGVRSAYPIDFGKTHVLLGDSWFDPSQPSNVAEFENQLKLRLTGAEIFNEGIGGSTLCDLIARFDTDVTPKNPDYVWVNSSINDYFNDVSASDFKLRLQYLISKIQAIGAKAIVFDSAPSAGDSGGGSDTRRNLSNGYAGAVFDLLDEAQ